MNNLTPLTPIDEPTTMSFLDAIKEITLGKKVTRISWANKDYCLLKDNWLEIFTNGEFHVWKVSTGDVEGNDWVITND